MRVTRGFWVTNEHPLKKTHTNIYGVLNRIRSKLGQSSIKNRGRIARKNYTIRSYFGRFVVKKNRRRYRKTLAKPRGRAIDFARASKLHLEIGAAIRRKKAFWASIKAARRARRGIFRYRGRMHAIKPFSFGFITILQRKRNFLAAVHRIHYTNKLTTRLLYKSSVSLTGYRSTKRGTDLGKKRVGRNINRFLRYVKFTSFDIVFPRRFTYRFREFFRGFLHKKSRFRVRRINITKRRSHGSQRKRKAKRK